jgi:hypothetical protein
LKTLDFTSRAPTIPLSQRATPAPALRQARWRKQPNQNIELSPTAPLFERFYKIFFFSKNRFARPIARPADGGEVRSEES